MKNKNWLSNRCPNRVFSNLDTIVKMKFCWLFLCGMLLCTHLCAQAYSDNVTLVQQDGNNATILAVGTGDKKKEAAEHATKSAFNALFHSGLPGLKNGISMLAMQRKDFEYLFFMDARYINYIVGEVESVDSEKISGRYRVTVRLTVNLKSLAAELQRNNLALNPNWMDSKTVKATAALNPTIVITPDMTDGRNLDAWRKEVLEEPTLKYAIGKLAEEFGKHGYTTQDAFVLLQNQVNSAIINMGTQTDIATEIMKRLPGDIVVYVDVKVNVAGKQSECHLELNAHEKQTGNVLSRKTYTSGKYMNTASVQLVDDAISKMKDDFFRTLQTKFEEVIRKGRTVVIKMALSQSVTDWDFDQESPDNGNNFKDELQTWLEAHCHQSVPNITLDTDKEIQLRMNIPLWNAERNKAYTLSNFSSDLRKFLRSQFGDNYKANVKASGQGINVIIE